MTTKQQELESTQIVDKLLTILQRTTPTEYEAILKQKASTSSKQLIQKLISKLTKHDLLFALKTIDNVELFQEYLNTHFHGELAKYPLDLFLNELCRLGCITIIRHLITKTNYLSFVPKEHLPTLVMQVYKSSYDPRVCALLIDVPQVDFTLMVVTNRTILHISCFKQLVDESILIFKKHPQLMLRNTSSGTTPLHELMGGAHISARVLIILKEFIRLGKEFGVPIGSYIDATDSTGTTALHRFVQKMYDAEHAREILDLMLQHGAVVSDSIFKTAAANVATIHMGSVNTATELLSTLIRADPHKRVAEVLTAIGAHIVLPGVIIKLIRMLMKFDCPHLVKNPSYISKLLNKFKTKVENFLPMDVLLYLMPHQEPVQDCENVGQTKNKPLITFFLHERQQQELFRMLDAGMPVPETYHDHHMLTLYRLRAAWRAKMLSNKVHQDVTMLFK